MPSLTKWRRPPPALEPRLAAPEDDCFWLYSSGSTGRPKGAVHAHRDMVVTSELYGVRVLGIGETDVSYSAAKLFFAYGLGNGMTFPLWVGGTAVLDDRRPTPDTTFSNIETFRPTIYYGVPTLYAAQLAALETGKRDLSSVRACVSAGEALPGDMFRRWKEQTGTIILDGIGSTEALHIFIGNRLDDHRPGTSGKPVPGYEVRILDENGDPVAKGESGRLWIKAESAARYYWNKPEKTAETMVNGWLNTGDTYREDEDGYFIYEGRSDDMLKVGGIWCSPVEIENCLVGHPAVLEAAVIGQTDEQSLIKPKAIVVLKQPGDAGAALTDALMAHCKQTLAPYKYPRWIEYVARTAQDRHRQDPALQAARLAVVLSEAKDLAERPMDSWPALRKSGRSRRPISTPATRSRWRRASPAATPRTLYRDPKMMGHIYIAPLCRARTGPDLRRRGCRRRCRVRGRCRRTPPPGKSRLERDWWPAAARTLSRSLRPAAGVAEPRTSGGRR